MDESAAAWHWPRSLMEYEINFIANVVPGFTPKHGAFIGDEAVIHGECNGTEVIGKLPWRRFLDSIRVYRGTFSEVLDAVRANQ